MQRSAATHDSRDVQSFVVSSKKSMTPARAMPALASAGGYTAMDIPHNTTWEIKGQ